MEIEYVVNKDLKNVSGPFSGHMNRYRAYSHDLGIQLLKLLGLDHLNHVTRISVDCDWNGISTVTVTQVVAKTCQKVERQFVVTEIMDDDPDNKPKGS